MSNQVSKHRRNERVGLETEKWKKKKGDKNFILINIPLYVSSSWLDLRVMKKCFFFSHFFSETAFGLWNTEGKIYKRPQKSVKETHTQGSSTLFLRGGDETSFCRRFLGVLRARCPCGSRSPCFLFPRAARERRRSERKREVKEKEINEAEVYTHIHVHKDSDTHT